MLGMGPKNAIGFGAQSFALRRFERSPTHVPTLQVKRSAQMHNVAAAGCVAGMVQCLVVVPSARINCQLQVQSIHRVLPPRYP